MKRPKLKKGDIVGNFEVISPEENCLKIHVKCKCGAEIFVKYANLKKTKSCKKCALHNTHLRYLDKAKEKIGSKFGSLKIVGVETKIVGVETIKKINYLICICKCGKKIKMANGNDTRRKSCGCMNCRGEKVPSSKLKEFEILSIREFFELGIYTQKELSEMFLVQPQQISRILKGMIWKHLPVGKKGKLLSHPKKKRAPYKKRLPKSIQQPEEGNARVIRPDGLTATSKEEEQHPESQKFSSSSDIVNDD